MSSRRKLKSDRELIADINKKAKSFCDMIYDDRVRGCAQCPLKLYDEADCRVAYIKYLYDTYK